MKTKTMVSYVEITESSLLYKHLSNSDLSRDSFNWKTYVNDFLVAGNFILCKG